MAAVAAHQLGVLLPVELLTPMQRVARHQLGTLLHVRPILTPTAVKHPLGMRYQEHQILMHKTVVGRQHGTPLLGRQIHMPLELVQRLAVGAVQLPSPLLEGGVTLPGVADRPHNGMVVIVHGYIPASK